MVLVARSRSLARTLLLVAGLFANAVPASAQLKAPPVAPPLPAPTGRVVSVSSVGGLQSAVDALTSGTTILIQPGTYRLTRTLRVRNGVTGVALRGATGNRADVVVLGGGMNSRGVDIAIKVENAQDVQIANLSVGQVYYHPIQLQGEQGAERVHVYNVRLFDAGEQFLKSTYDPGSPDGVDGVTVEYSVFEYTTIGPSDGYTQGIDVHHGARWVIRYNLFRNIRVPATAPMRNRPAILLWSGSRDTLVYGNTIVNCERGIIFGLGPQPGHQFSHFGGAIFNNMIYRTEKVNADAGISVWDSPHTLVYHNTVIQNGTYKNAIEYRFPSTVAVQIVNNLTDGAIARRDGAQATVIGNLTDAGASLFVNSSVGDLHLRSTSSSAIDAGVAVEDVAVDWDGQARPAGAGWDIGADEVPSAPANRAPVARLAATPTSGTAPLTVTFDAGQSSDPDGDTLACTWSFGDGQSGSGVRVTHQYGSGGTFTARLTVSDPGKLSSSASASIAVTPPAPAPSLLAAPSNLTGAVLSGPRVRLQWRDNSVTETGFLIERTRGTQPFVTIGRASAGATSFVDTRVIRGSVRYRVIAFDSQAREVSPYSNIVTVTVP